MAEREARAKGPRRFYTEAAVVPAASGHGIALDGRPLRTPQRVPLAVPTQTFAEAIAAEWQAQSEHIVPATMPLTRLANVAIDRLGGERGPVIGEIATYLGSDLVFYRAEAPDGLVAAQARAWDPLVAWAEAEAGCRLMLSAGIVHVAQPPRLASAFSRRLAAVDDFQLAALSLATTLTGSALIALALGEGLIAAEPAWAAAHVDEDWQIALWGEDAEARARRAFHKRDFDAAALVLGALRT